MKKLFCAIALVCAFASVSFSESNPPVCRDGEIPILRNGKWSCVPDNLRGSVEESSEDYTFEKFIKTFFDWIV